MDMNKMRKKERKSPARKKRKSIQENKIKRRISLKDIRNEKGKRRGKYVTERERERVPGRKAEEKE